MRKKHVNVLIQNHISRLKFVLYKLFTLLKLVSLLIRKECYYITKTKTPQKNCQISVYKVPFDTSYSA